jgi:hypothetical protein
MYLLGALAYLSACCLAFILVAWPLSRRRALIVLAAFSLLLQLLPILPGRNREGAS